MYVQVSAAESVQPVPGTCPLALANADAPGATPGAAKALVVDDAPDTRIFVRALLQKWGYAVEVAGEGHEGLARIKEAAIPLVICDWMMPGMSGPDLCRAVREADLGHYVYIILLTGRSDQADLIEGLNAGADDFLSKPFDIQVLQARLRVAERILALEYRLSEQNRRLGEAYGRIQADLTAAARVQRRMLPTSDRAIAPLRAEWMFLPAARVSGDSFNFFELTEDRIGFFHLDVSGHGIPAALLSASISRSLIPGGGRGHACRGDFLDPARLLADLNRELEDPDEELESFATLAYGTIDKRTGETVVALAGHPCPIVLRRSGEIETLTPGGLPVGIFPDALYESQRLRLDPGDRLVLYSDGVTECENPAGQAFGGARLDAVTGAAGAGGTPGVTTAIEASLREWRGKDDFEDDISVLVLLRPAAAGVA